MLLNNPRLNINGGDIQSAAAEIEKIELERQKRSEVQSDKLVKSIQDLTKTLINTERDAARNKTGGGFTLRGLISDKVEGIKGLSTGSGLFGALAGNTNNPIMSSIFGSLAERSAGKEAQQQKTKDFVSSVASGTTYGRELTGRVGSNRAAELLKEDYKKQQALETKIYAREEKRRAMIESGKKSGVETDLDEAELAELEQYKAQLQEAKEKYKRQSIPMAGDSTNRAQTGRLDRIEPPTQPIDGTNDTTQQTETTETGRLIRSEQNVTNRISSDASELQEEDFKQLKSDLLQSIKEGMQQEIGVLPKSELDALRAQGPDFINGVGSQIFEEIQALSKEQLVQLIKISDLLEVDKEQLLESKTKSLLGPLEDTGAAPADAAPQLLGKLIDKFGGTITGMLGGMLTSLKGGVAKLGGVVAKGLTPLLGGAAKLGGTLLKGLAPFLGPAAGVAGAGAAGYMAGGAINDLVEQKTGDTVGGNVYSGVQKFKQFIGLETDEDKMKKAEKQSVVDLIEKKKKAGEPISNYLVEQAKKYNIDITGIATQSSLTTTTDVSAAQSNAVNRTDLDVNTNKVIQTNLIDGANNLQNIIDNTSNINKQVSKDLMKINTASVLEQATDQSMTQKITNNAAQNPVIVNAPQTVNNQNMQIVRPPLRNADPSWLDTTGKRLAY